MAQVVKIRFIVGQNIRILRERAGWNQAIFAQRLNISVPALSKIETGITDINLSRLRQIADKMGISIYALLQESEIDPVSLQSRNNFDEIMRAKDEEIKILQKKVIELLEELYKLCSNDKEDVAEKSS